MHGHQNSAVEKLRDFNRFADLRIQQKVEAVFKKMRGSSASSFCLSWWFSAAELFVAFLVQGKSKTGTFLRKTEIKDSQTRKLKWRQVMQLESTANWYLRLVNPEAQTRRYPDYRGVCVRGLKPWEVWVILQWWEIFHEMSIVFISSVHRDRHRQTNWWCLK